MDRYQMCFHFYNNSERYDGVKSTFSDPQAIFNKKNAHTLITRKLQEDDNGDVANEH